MFKNFLKNHSFSEFDFRSDFLPGVSDREFWEAFPDDDIISSAEAEINFSWPIIKATDFMEYKISGNRSIMERPHFDRRRHLVLFTLAELKENQGRFLPQIVNGLWTICEETYWGLSAHMPNRSFFAENIPSATEPYIDLFAAETAEQLTTVTHVLRDSLEDFCPKILDRVNYELEKRIKESYLFHRDYNWMGYNSRPNNWNPWILSNVLTVFLLTEKNEKRLHRALHKTFLEIQNYYDAIPSDGGCDEGPSYWGRAGASLFEFLYQLKQSTDGALNLFDDEKIRLIGAYLKKVHVCHDLFVNVADAHAIGRGNMMTLVYGYARETGQTELMNFSAAVYKEKTVGGSPCSYSVCTLRRIIYCAEFLKEMENYEIRLPLHPTLECLPVMELATLRQGDLFLSAKGGFNNESHNHNDVGSFTFYDGSTPVLIDVGISTYTRFTFSKERYTLIPWVKSTNHNVPIINGYGQPFGKDFRSDLFEADEDSITVSFKSAYPEKAGLLSLTRRLCLTDVGMKFTDSFAFSNNENQSITEVMMTTLPVRIENGAAIIGDMYCIKCKSASAENEYLPFEDSHLEADWKCKGVNRIIFSAVGISDLEITVEKYQK